MQFQLCDNTDFFLRLALLGPSGSGKTFTALRLVTELGYEKVAIIDTENRSARRYARQFSQRFMALELDQYSPAHYIDAIHIAEKEGIQALVIDSLSHAWMGKGGVLEMVDNAAKRQSRGGSASSFNGWREVTPEHNRLVNTMIQAKLHLIVTMRVKTDYVVEQDQRGKSVPRKVGLAPVQRDGLEYEFDVIGDITLEHDLIVTKSRCPGLADQVIHRPGAELAHTLRAWVDGAVRAPREEVQPPPDGAVHVSQEEVPPPAPPAPRKGWRERVADATTGDALDDLDVRVDAALHESKLTTAQAEELRELIHQRRQALEGDRR